MDLATIRTKSKPEKIKILPKFHQKPTSYNSTTTQSNTRLLQTDQNLHQAPPMSQLKHQRTSFNAPTKRQSTTKQEEIATRRSKYLSHRNIVVVVRIGAAIAGNDLQAGALRSPHHLLCPIFSRVFLLLL